MVSNLLSSRKLGNGKDERLIIHKWNSHAPSMIYTHPGFTSNSSVVSIISTRRTKSKLDCCQVYKQMLYLVVSITANIFIINNY